MLTIIKEDLNRNIYYFHCWKTAFCVTLNNLIPKYVWKCKELRKLKFEKNKIGGIMLIDFKDYYEATVVMSVKSPDVLEKETNGKE